MLSVTSSVCVLTTNHDNSASAARSLNPKPPKKYLEPPSKHGKRALNTSSKPSLLEAGAAVIGMGSNLVGKESC